MMWWLIAVPLAVLADALLDEDRRTAWVKRWTERRCVDVRRAPSLVASPEHVAMLEIGLRAARSRWEENVEGGWMALADGDMKTILRLSRELDRIPPSPEPVESR